jgi:hypothetical protein
MTMNASLERLSSGQTAFRQPLVHPTVRPFAPRKNPFTAPRAGIPDSEIPGFLKRGPAHRKERDQG